jgi:signal transduction histidine kinase
MLVELADLLDARRDEIVGRWRTRVRAELIPGAPPPNETELVDHLPEILRALSQALRHSRRSGSGIVIDPRPAEAVARRHGMQRFRVGFDLRVVVREYGLLHDVIFELASEAGFAAGLEPLLARLITAGISEAVVEYVEVRDRSLQDRIDFEEQLIGIVSHDLRSPLAAISMGAETLALNRDLDPHAAMVVSRIVSSCQRANRMIGDLLDFTKARFGGGITIHRARHDFHEIVRHAVDEIRVRFPGREIRIDVEGDGVGEWDGDRISQVVTNLLNNAVAYSPDDSIITVATRGDDDEVSLVVNNRGAPILEELMPRLFEPMVRGKAEASNPGRSIGLGLYIVDQIVRAHGGRIDVTSTQAEGTTFTVHLPRT